MSLAPLLFPHKKTPNRKKRGDNIAICFLCEKEKDDLQNHHLIPGYLVRMEPFKKWEKCGGTVKLCPKCHKKITWMLGIIELILKDGLETEEVK